MLTQQFFTRVQLTKILNFKSDGSIKDLEKKGFLIPQIKPSKYTFNQVLFMMICKEITCCTDLNWKCFIDFKLNTVLQYNLMTYDLLVFSYQFRRKNELSIDLINDATLIKGVNDYLDGDLLKYTLQRMNLIAKELGIEIEKDIPTCDTRGSKDYRFLTFSIERVYQKLHNKCIELNIDLKEKYSLKSTFNNDPHPHQDLIKADKAINISTSSTSASPADQLDQTRPTPAPRKSPPLP